MPPIQTVYYIVYSKAPVKEYSGLLGTIDLQCVWFLLSGGKTILEEQYIGSDPIGWYTSVLESQDMIVASSKIQKYKGHSYVWIEIDFEKTPIHEYTTWRDISENDTETLAWRPFWIPFEHGTTKECLGFAVSNRDCLLQSTTAKNPLSLQTVFDAIYG